MAKYGKTTVQDLIDFINDNPKFFPNGMNTEIWSGDFEGNYTHIKHELMYDNNALFIGYEMHEDMGE
jgi:hypothetical protein